MEMILLILGVSVFAFFYFFICYVIYKTAEIVKEDEKELDRRYKEFEKRQEEYLKSVDKIVEKYS